MKELNAKQTPKNKISSGPINSSTMGNMDFVEFCKQYNGVKI